MEVAKTLDDIRRLKIEYKRKNPSYKPTDFKITQIIFGQKNNEKFNEK